MSLTFFFTKLFFNYQNIKLISVKNVYDRTSRVSPKMSEKVSWVFHTSKLPVTNQYFHDSPLTTGWWSKHGGQNLKNN